MADTPCWSGPLPVLFTGAFQTKQYNTDLIVGVGDNSVFDAVNAPPAAATTPARSIPTAIITRP
jgi:hypothetical protein